MIKKIATIIFVAIILGISSWFYYKQTMPISEEESKDEISILLEGLKGETKIDFSEIEKINFKWITKIKFGVEEKVITGKGFEANNISESQYNSIEQFLVNNGFEVDVNNIAGGTVVGLMGYRTEDVVCTVSGGITGYEEAEEQWNPVGINTKDVIVSCGNFKKMEFIRVNTPLPNQTIQSPLVILGEARGYWFFEASFPIILVDWDGLIIGQAIAQAKDDWMTEDFVPFEAVIEFEVPIVKNNGALILRKDNPSGLPENDDAFEVPVFFDQDDNI